MDWRPRPCSCRHSSGSQKIESGPILSAVKAESFDSVYLISDYKEAPLIKSGSLNRRNSPRGCVA